MIQRLTTALLVALVAIAIGVDAGYIEGRSLLQSLPSISEIRASCRTVARASITARNGATGRVRAVSTCKAFASSVDTIEEVVKEFYETIDKDPENTCTVVKLNDVIERCAIAMAKVFASALVEIDLVGDAQACAEARSEGDAFASAYSRIILNIWLGATDGKEFAEAEARVDIIERAVSSAWASAKKRRCQIGTGSLVDAEESFVEDVNLAISCVMIELSVRICELAFSKETTDCGKCGPGELNALLESTESVADVKVCSSHFKVDGETKSPTGAPNTVDLALPVVASAPFCGGNENRCCAPIFKSSPTCFCGRGCLLNKRGDVWVSVSGTTRCKCPSTP